LRTFTTSTGCYIGGIYQSDKYSYSHIGKFLTVGNKPVIKFVIETVKYFFWDIEFVILAFMTEDIGNHIRTGKKRNHFVEPGAAGLAPIAGTLNFYR